MAPGVVPQSSCSFSAHAPPVICSSIGWGRDAYGEEPWGSSDDAVVSLTAPSSLSTSIGSVTAFNEQGWGRDPWGYENWGESAMTVVVDVSGVSLGSSVGAISVSYTHLTLPTTPYV